MSFEGKTVLVTGSTSGIGRAAAEQFGSAGAHVIVTGRDETRGREVVDAIESAGGQARFVAADLSAPDGARSLAQAAGDVDVLVNNAGIFPFGPSHEIPIEDVKTVLDFNVVAPFTLTAAFVPGMIERGSGAIVNVSTMVASFGLPGMSAYGASKAALELLDQGLGRGVRAGRRAGERSLARADSYSGDGRHGRGGDQSTRRNAAARTCRRSPGDRQHDHLPRLRRRQLHQRRHRPGRRRPSRGLNQPQAAPATGTS